MGFKKVPAEQLDENFIRDIGSEWMLVTAGDRDGYNMMTASGGFAGVMWGFPCAITAIRPQRYTMEFLEKGKYFTLSFYGENKKLHAICGKQSGRDIDKTAATGLTPMFDDETGAPYFEQARLVLVCEKVYAQSLNPENFLDGQIRKTSTPAGIITKCFTGKFCRCSKKRTDFPFNANAVSYTHLTLPTKAFV